MQKNEPFDQENEEIHEYIDELDFDDEKKPKKSQKKKIELKKENLLGKLKKSNSQIKEKNSKEKVSKEFEDDFFELKFETKSQKDYEDEITLKENPNLSEKTQADEKESEVKEVILKDLAIDQLDEPDVIINDPDKSGRTKHFSIKEHKEEAKNEGETQFFDKLKGKYTPQEVDENFNRTRKNLMENFRVLSKTDQSDEAIQLDKSETEPEKSLIDSIDEKNCDDIFDAIDHEEKKNLALDNLLRVGSQSIRSIQDKARREQRKKALNKAKKTKHSLEKTKSKLQLKKKCIYVISSLSLIMYLLSFFYQPNGALEFMFKNNAALYIGINIALVAAICLILVDVFISAINSIRQLKPNANTYFIIITFFVLLHQLTLLGVGKLVSEKVYVYTLCACFAGFSCVYSKLEQTSKQISMIDAISSGRQLYSVQCIDNKVDTEIFSNKSKYSSILYTTQTQVPENFEEFSNTKPKMQKLYGYLLMGSMIICFVVSMIGLFKTRQSIHLVTNFVSCLCMCFPLLKKGVDIYLSKKANEKLGEIHCMAKGYESIKMAGEADAIVMKAKDLFQAQVAMFKLVPGARIRLNDVVILTAVTLSQSKSILASCFDEFTQKMGIELPIADELEIENTVGIKSQIEGLNVIVGSREMLEKNSIQGIPTLIQENSYAKKQKVIYVVVNEKIVATFLVDYSITTQALKSASQFNDLKMSLLVDSIEIGLDEDLISKKLKINLDKVKVLDKNSIQIVDEYKSNTTLHKASGLICAKDKSSVLSLVSISSALYLADKVGDFIYWFGCAVSFILVAASVILLPSIAFNPLTIVALHCLWAVVAVFAAKKQSIEK